MATYDVVETNIFGYLPVFLVVPRLDLLLDEEVLRYVNVASKADSRPMVDLMVSRLATDASGSDAEDD